MNMDINSGNEKEKIAARQRFILALYALARTNSILVERDLSELYQGSIDSKTGQNLVMPQDLVNYSRVFERTELAQAGGSILSMFHVLSVKTKFPGAPLELIVDAQNPFASQIKSRLAAVIEGRGIGWHNRQAQEMAVEIYKALAAKGEAIPQIPDFYIEAVCRSEPLPDDAINSEPIPKALPEAEAQKPAKMSGNPYSKASKGVTRPVAPKADGKKAQPQSPVQPEAKEMPSPHFAKEFAVAFPTLAARIPTEFLTSEAALWRRLSTFFPNQADFERQLHDLVRTRNIFNASGLQYGLLPQILKGEFAPQSAMPEVFCEPEFVRQFARKEDILEKCIGFARLMETASGKYREGGTLAVNADAMQKTLTKGKGKVDESELKPILRYYNKVDSPVVDGHLTPSAVHLIQKWKIPFGSVARIFGDDLLDKELPVANAPHRAKPAQSAEPAPVPQLA